MGKKLDALLGRTFKASKFKPLVGLAISRLGVFKNHRQVRCSQSRSDVVELLKLGHHERALLRVEHVIKEQNMYDAFVMLESYCNLLIERVHLIEQERECPDELKEASSSLLYASSRVGEFPELQQIRNILISRFGKEFAARAIELRNHCAVNPKIIAKLSTRQPTLEDRMKVLKEIASEDNIALQLEEAGSVSTEENLDANKWRNQPGPSPSANSGNSSHGGDFQIPPEEMGKDFSDPKMAHKKYKDVADAAQAAFQSAAYAAAAARAAVELSRSEPHDPDDQGGPATGGGNMFDRQEIHIEDRDEEVKQKNAADVKGQADPFDKELRFDEIGNEQSSIVSRGKIPFGFRGGLKVESAIKAL